MLLMYIEAMVVITRQKNHFRVTRCLRIVFFIDSYIMVGMRRYENEDSGMGLKSFNP